MYVSSPLFEPAQQLYGLFFDPYISSVVFHNPAKIQTDKQQWKHNSGYEIFCVFHSLYYSCGFKREV